MPVYISCSYDMLSTLSLSQASGQCFWWCYNSHLHFIFLQLLQKLHAFHGNSMWLSCLPVRLISISYLFISFFVYLALLALIWLLLPLIWLLLPLIWLLLLLTCTRFTVVKQPAHKRTPCHPRIASFTFCIWVMWLYLQSIAWIRESVQVHAYMCTRSHTMLLPCLWCNVIQLCGLFQSCAFSHLRHFNAI